jgi:hypothetical protein
VLRRDSALQWWTGTEIALGSWNSVTYRIGYNRRRIFYMFHEGLESRLRIIEQEIMRLVRLSAEVSEPDQQDNYLRLAQDLQREARELRTEIKKQTEPKLPAAGDFRFREPRAKNSHVVLSE